MSPALPSYRPTWAEISAPVFSSNVAQLKKWVGPSVQLLAVLKANAYGHNAEALAPLALKNGASIIGVSSLEEAIALRKSRIKAPILILGSIYPLENFSVVLKHNLTPTIGSHEAYLALKKIAGRSKSWSFHLKVDTGMGRIGVSLEEARRIIGLLAREKSAHLGGVYTHLSTADSDLEFARHQLDLFNSLKEFARAQGFSKTLFHIANSAALLSSRDFHLDLVRPGLALYGVPPVALPAGVSLTPVLSWHTRVVFWKKVPAGTSIGYGRTFITKRESMIATLPVGYADGLPRSVSNKGVVLIQGRRCPIVGRVSMDQTMIDVTGLSIKVGESVILIGNQGKESLPVSEWASWAGTLTYEVLCGLSHRVPRRIVTK